MNLRRKVSAMALLAIAFSASSSAFAEGRQEEAIGSGKFYATIDSAYLYYNGERILPPLSLYIAENDSALYVDGTVEREGRVVPVRRVLTEYEPIRTQAQRDSIRAQRTSPRLSPRLQAQRDVNHTAKAVADSVLSAGGSCAEAAQAALAVYQASPLVDTIPSISERRFIVVWKGAPNGYCIKEDFCPRGRPGRGRYKPPEELMMFYASDYENLLGAPGMVLLGREGPSSWYRARYKVIIPRTYVEPITRLIGDIRTNGWSEEEGRELREYTGGAFAADLKGLVTK